MMHDEKELDVTESKGGSNRSSNNEVPKKYFITEDINGNKLVYNVMKSGETRGYVIDFAYFYVTYATILVYDRLYNRRDDIIIIFNNGGQLMMPFDDLDPKNIINIMRRNGFSFLLKRSDEFVGRLFIQYLTNKLPPKFYVPYNSGWGNNTMGGLSYFSNGQNYGIWNINSPFLCNHFNIAANADSTVSIKETLKLYKDYFNDEDTRIVMPAILVYSLLFSLYKIKCRMDIQRIVLLNSCNYNSSILLRTADMFLNVFDSKTYPHLEQKKKDFESRILKTKDEPLIINCSKMNSGNNCKNRLEYMRKLFVEGSSFEVNDNSYNTNCLLVCIGGELEHTLADHEIIEVILISYKTVIQKIFVI